MTDDLVSCFRSSFTNHSLRGPLIPDSKQASRRASLGDRKEPSAAGFSAGSPKSEMDLFNLQILFYAVTLLRLLGDTDTHWWMVSS